VHAYGSTIGIAAAIALLASVVVAWLLRPAAVAEVDGAIEPLSGLDGGPAFEAA
jgi:hypothetical protein